MKLISARIDWHWGWANQPTLSVYVDKIPNHKDLFYNRHASGRGMSYFAELDGYVNFFHHDPQDQSGYGGSVFTVQTGNGLVQVKGPWSSRASVMSKYFTACIDVTITDRPDTWEGNGSYMAGAITLELAREAMKLVAPETFGPIKFSSYNLGAFDVYGDGEISYIPVARLAGGSHFVKMGGNYDPTDTQVNTTSNKAK